MAISLGTSSAPGMPVRGHVSDFFERNTGLQSGAVYAGHGHSPTKWENRFVEGRDGTHVDIIFKYIMTWDSLQLDGALDELTGETIVCDCPANSFCHVDVIIAKYLIGRNVHESLAGLRVPRPDHASRDPAGTSSSSSFQPSFRHVGNQESVPYVGFPRSQMAVVRRPELSSLSFLPPVGS